MTHAEETQLRWKEIGWMDSVCEEWEAFFESLVDEPQRAEAMCALGMKVVQCDLGAVPGSASGRWIAYFGLLVGRLEVAEQLCGLGLKVVRRELIFNEATRSLVRAVLHAYRRSAIR